MLPSRSAVIGSWNQVIPMTATAAVPRPDQIA